jgi:hypothetical protein
MPSASRGFKIKWTWLGMQAKLPRTQVNMYPVSAFVCPTLFPLPYPKILPPASLNSVLKNDNQAKLKRFAPWLHYWINITGFGELKS